MNAKTTGWYARPDCRLSTHEAKLWAMRQRALAAGPAAIASVPSEGAG